MAYWMNWMKWMNIEVFDVCCKQQRPENPTCSSLGASQLVSPVACADALLWGQLLDMPSTQLQLSPTESN